MLIGKFEHSLDAKGRVTVPGRFRDDLGEHFVITQGMDRNLYIYPLEQWDNFTAKLTKLPLGNKGAREIVTFFTGSASEGELDKQGRVLIQGELRNFAKMVKDVVFIGAINRVEVWSREVYLEKMATVDTDPETMNERLEEKMEEFGL